MANLPPLARLALAVTSFIGIFLEPAQAVPRVPAAAVAAAAAARGTRTWIWYEEGAKNNSGMVLHNGKGMPRAGDTFYWAGSIVAKAHGKSTQVGTDTGECMVLPRFYMQCTTLININKYGSLVGTGGYALSDKAFFYAITGGTGRLRGASGQILVKALDGTLATSFNVKYIVTLD
ncbi:hypothetical protein CLOM_g7503 [Closterium sp. NIES-68]|nr:hypothetical protein CLOM_g7503 [Closterium sp. NIES-68]GJP80386.1 hypothetical protein CLOP_g10598 [Closterium sp. NIES-67]